MVTGTLINNPNITASAPISSVGADEIALRQSNTADQILRDLPGAVANLGAATAIGNAGSSYADLRGLGSFRNIVLIDGRRITPSSVVGRVDLNNVPLAVIERSEALTGGAATTYGADAVSGVINFITRRNFQGLELTGSSQISEQGDGGTYRISVTAGRNFAGGRGNLLVSAEYQKSNEILQGDRELTAYRYNSVTGKYSGNNNAVPGTYTLGTAINVVDPTTGRLRAYTDADGYNPNLAQNLQAPFERYNAFASTHFDVTDNVTLYARGLYSHNKVTAIVGSTGLSNAVLTIPVSNPYLPQAAREQFCASNDFNPSVAGIQTITQTGTTCALAAAALSPSDPNFRTFTTSVGRRVVELGPRLSEFTTDAYDVLAGVKVGLTDSISLDLSGAYGKSENNLERPGLLLTGPVQSALYATNTTTCLGGAPNGAPLMNNGATCVPINLFGASGSITPAMLPYLIATAYSSNNASLGQARALLSGDFGFSSPWASEPINFAAGAEYRKYQAAQVSDTLSKTPGAIAGASAVQPDYSGGYNVREVYGEIIAPIVADRPFFRELTLEAGIRQSSYKIDVAGDSSFQTTTFKLGGSWTPVRSIKIRGNFQRAVRAPNIAELFSPAVSANARLAIDPCAGSAPVTNADLRAVCLAQGVPAAAIGILTNPTSQEVRQTTSGSTSLKPETANSYTLGIIFQPAFAPRLSIAIDYYNISVTDAISQLTIPDVIANCFGNVTSSSAASTACGPTFFRRNTVTGGLAGDSTVLGVITPASNAGRILTDGIDLSINYRHNLSFADLILNFQGNWTNRSKFQPTASSIYRECVGYYSAACGSPASNNPSAAAGFGAGSIQPEYSWNMRTTLSFEPVDVSLLWRHVSAVDHEPIDTLVPFAGTITEGPLNGETVNFGHIPAYNLFDLSLRFKVSDQFELTATALNLLNKEPPIVGSTIGASAFNTGNTYPSTYDAIGRRFAVSAKVNF